MAFVKDINPRFGGDGTDPADFGAGFLVNQTGITTIQTPDGTLSQALTNVEFASIANFLQTTDNVVAVTDENSIGALQTEADGNDYHHVTQDTIFVLYGEILLVDGGVSFAPGVHVLFINAFKNQRSNPLPSGGNNYIAIIDNGDGTVNVQTLSLGTITVGTPIVFRNAGSYDSLYRVTAVDVPNNIFTIESPFFGSPPGGEYKISRSPGLYLDTGNTQPLFYADDINYPAYLGAYDVIFRQFSSGDNNELFNFDVQNNDVAIQFDRVTINPFSRLGMLKGTNATFEAGITNSTLNWTNQSLILNDLSRIYFDNNYFIKGGASSDPIFNIEGSVKIFNHRFSNNTYSIPNTSNGYIRVSPNINDAAFITFDDEWLDDISVPFFNTQTVLGQKNIDQTDHRISTFNCPQTFNSNPLACVTDLTPPASDLTVFPLYQQSVVNPNLYQIAQFFNNSGGNVTATITNIVANANNDFITMTVPGLNTVGPNPPLDGNVPAGTFLRLTDVPPYTGEHRVVERIDDNTVVLNTPFVGPPDLSGSPIAIRLTFLQLDVLHKFQVECRSIAPPEIGNGSVSPSYALIFTYISNQPAYLYVQFNGILDLQPNNNAPRGSFGFFLNPNTGIFNPLFKTFQPLGEGEARQAFTMKPVYFEKGYQITPAIIYNSSGSVNSFTIESPSTQIHT